MVAMLLVRLLNHPLASFLVGGNFRCRFLVVFLILVIINFMVITKGAGPDC